DRSTCKSPQSTSTAPHCASVRCSNTRSTRAVTTSPGQAPRTARSHGPACPRPRPSSSTPSTKQLTTSPAFTLRPEPDPRDAVLAVLTLPDRGVFLQTIDEQLAGVERLRPMRRAGSDDDSEVPDRERADAVLHRHLRPRKLRLRLLRDLRDHLR